MIGELQRAFCGAGLFGSDFPPFVHHGRLVGRVRRGRAIHQDNETNDLIVSVSGGISKGGRNRLKGRADAAKSAQGAAGRPEKRAGRSWWKPFTTEICRLVQEHPVLAHRRPSIDTGTHLRCLVRQLVALCQEIGSHRRRLTGRHASLVPATRAAATPEPACLVILDGTLLPTDRPTDRPTALLAAATLYYSGPNTKGTA
ncbi:hypothetical protein [Streptomyces europaeiscabiei]|uniref:hypothetical protein n=1 Tax=Streptomyces europaeiscabiei TaxID=146819 RepID=UPI002E0EB1E7|nr:hypothetical protein OHB30_48220 [Streptomyces europaeiscabiei]